MESILPPHPHLPVGLLSLPIHSDCSPLSSQIALWDSKFILHHVSHLTPNVFLPPAQDYLLTIKMAEECALLSPVL